MAGSSLSTNLLNVFRMYSIEKIKLKINSMKEHVSKLKNLQKSKVHRRKLILGNSKVRGQYTD